MPAPRRTARIDSDAYAPVGRVFESGGHGERGGELSVYLGLGGARADGAPGDEVGGVLGADGVEEFAAGGEAELGDVDEEGAGDAEAFVDLEAAVHVGVVDEPLPADGRAGLFEVDAHDDVEVAAGLVGVCFELVGVFERGLDVMHRARPRRCWSPALFGNNVRTYPTTTTRRSSWPCRISSVACRPVRTVSAPDNVLQ